MGDDRERQYKEYLAMRERAERNKARETGLQDESGYYVSNRPRYSEEEYRRQEMERMEQQRLYEEEIRRREREAYMAAREKAGPSPSYPSGNDGGRKRKKGRSGFRIFAMIVLMLFLALGGLAGVGYAIVNSVLNNIGHVDVDVNNIGIDPDVDNELSQYRNIAVLGIDSRDMEDDSDARSDSIIIVSMDKETNEIKMFSIFRDTMLNLGEDVGYNGLDKITHAYYYGKAERSLYALNRNLDLNIKEVVVVNWKAVADTIDAVGGIDINIEEAEMNEMNKFIHETSKKTGLEDEDIDITETGEQTVNGVQAVTYARIRKDALTGDYRRNERMKIVVKATFDKAVSNLNFDMIKQIATVVMPEIKTNIESKELMEMVIHLGDYKMNDTTTGWPYDVGEWVGDAWYGPPRTLYSNVVKLHENFFNQKGYVPTEDVENISYNISYLTGLY